MSTDPSEMTPAQVEERLQEITAREAVAQPGPWSAEDPADFACGAMCSPDGCQENHPVGAAVVLEGPEPDQYELRFHHEEDAVFVAEAREDIPFLLKLVKEQREEIAEHDALMDLQHQRMKEATTRWHDAGKSDRLTYPDLGALLAFLLDEIERLEAHGDARTA